MTLSTHPHLLYVHPYASGPFPFRVVVYLAEKQISETAVKVVPRTEDETANAFPSMPTGLRPILGIPKDDGSFVGTKPESYTWLSQSSIIIEYLEDLCDSNPDISPVPSLRGGGNLVEQAQIRSVGALVDSFIETFGLAATFANKNFPSEKYFGIDHIEAAGEPIMKLAYRRALEPLSTLLLQTCPFEAIASGKPGTATSSGCILWSMLAWAEEEYGLDFTVGYEGLTKFKSAWANRESAKLKLTGYPLGTRAGWPEGLWNDGQWIRRE